MADYTQLVRRALARSQQGNGGTATQQRLNLPVPYETLRQNTMKQAQIDGHPFSQPHFDSAVLKHALNAAPSGAGNQDRRAFRRPSTPRGDYNQNARVQRPS